MRVVTGNWVEKSGALTVTVTKAEKSYDDYLRLHVRVDNSASYTRTLPLKDNFEAVDNTGKTYPPSPDSEASQWPGSIPAHGSVSGVIALGGQIEPSAKSLTISFAAVLGYAEPSPPQGITVKGIVLPP
ncbi:hypothetical protein [Streptomyces sp. NPDC002671]